MQSAEGPDAPNGDRNLPGHARRDSPIEENPPTRHFANVDQRRALVLPPAPTEPQVTNVTSPSTSSVFIGDDEGVAGQVLLQPAAGLIVERDHKPCVHQPIMATLALARLGRNLLTADVQPPISVEGPLAASCGSSAKTPAPSRTAATKSGSGSAPTNELLRLTTVCGTPRTRNWFERCGNSFASTQIARTCGDASAIRLARLTARGQ